MKIIRLQANNVLKLVAVDIAPTGDLVIVGGKNGAGKSSVLNSIAMALGGATMCPQEPIRAGETEAKIEVDLGDLRVTRRFSRTKYVTKCDYPISKDNPVGGGVIVGHAHTDKCEWSWGDTTSTLVVTNKDGARYPSPQAMLDKLLGKLTFDPLAFSRMDARSQDAALRELTGLDMRDIEARRKAAFDQRAMLKKTLAIKEAQLAALPKHEGVPDAEVPMAEVSAEMLKAEEYRKLADDARREVDRLRDERTTLVTQKIRMSDIADGLAAQIEQLRLKMVDADDQVVLADVAIKSKLGDIDAAQVTADAALAIVPDVTVIRARLAEVEATNVKVRANKTRNAAQGEVTVLHGEVAVQNKAVVDADEEKANALKAAQFPVPGLGLSDEGVTFGGLPLAQASSSEQLRVSVAIGLSLNPQLRVLLIRNGNMLDEDSMALVAKQAEDANAQLWVEWVGADASEVSVMIEDGRVKETA